MAGPLYEYVDENYHKGYFDIVLKCSSYDSSYVERQYDTKMPHSKTMDYNNTHSFMKKMVSLTIKMFVIYVTMLLMKYIAK